MKRATITITKQSVLSDIDSITYKKVDGVLSGEGVQLKNAVSSDSEDSNDNYLLQRYMEGRDACLRGKLAFCLVPEENESLEVTNDIEEDESFVFRLNVPDYFNRDIVKSLTKKIHRYFVDATLFDWYGKQGMDSGMSADDIEEQLTDIAVSLRKPFVKRPLQPFGPAL